MDPTLLEAGIDSVTLDAKTALAGLSVFDIETPAGASPLHLHIGRFVHAVAECLVEKRSPSTAEELGLPTTPSPLALSAFKQLLDGKDG